MGKLINPSGAQEVEENNDVHGTSYTPGGNGATPDEILEEEEHKSVKETSALTKPTLISEELPASAEKDINGGGELFKSTDLVSQLIT